MTAVGRGVRAEQRAHRVTDDLDREHAQQVEQEQRPQDHGDELDQSSGYVAPHAIPFPSHSAQLERGGQPWARPPHRSPVSKLPQSDGHWLTEISLKAISPSPWSYRDVADVVGVGDRGLAAPHRDDRHVLESDVTGLLVERDAPLPA